MRRGIIPRILITLLGIALILTGTFQTILGFAGKSTYAVITNIRREGGERTDTKPGRYTYVISYTFTLPDGKKVDGFTKEIRDAVYSKVDGTGTVKVRYLPGFPHINFLDKDTGFGAGQIIIIAAGMFLIYFMRKPSNE